MSDIKPVLERQAVPWGFRTGWRELVETCSEVDAVWELISWAMVDTEELAACVRELAEASMRHKHARRLTTEEAIKVQQGEDVPIFIDKECPLCAALAKYGLSEGSER